MAIIKRADHKTNYTVISNEIPNHPDLSWEAVGLLVFLLSKPPHWTVNINHLSSVKDAGRTKIRRILTELEDSGYALCNQSRDESGQFTTEWIIYDVSQGANGGAKGANGGANGTNSIQKPRSEPTQVYRRGSTDAGQPTRVTAPIVSKELATTEIVNTEVVNFGANDFAPHEETQLSLLGEPARPDKKKTKKKDEPYTEEFLKCWEHYPKKKFKKEAWNAWIARVRAKTDPELLLRATINYAKYCKLNNTPDVYIARGSTFYGPNEKWIEYLELERDWGNPSQNVDDSDDEGGYVDVSSILLGNADD